MNSVRIEKIYDPVTTANTYVLIDGDGALIIDPNDSKKIIEMMERFGVLPEAVILSHEHADHISGLNGLREKYRFTTYASSLCSLRMQDIRNNLSRIFGVYLVFVTGERVRNYPKFVCEAADVTFEDRLLFSWRDHTFELVATPGHAAGCISILMDNKVLFSGDSLFGDRGVVTRFLGGSEEEYLNIAKPYLMSLPGDIIVYPGHGEPFPLKDGVFEILQPEVEL